MTHPADAATLARLRAAIAFPSGSGEQRCPTGFPDLDEALGGGLPRDSLTEIYTAAAGSGVLEALLPSLARGSSRWLTWIHPSSTPYPPALAQAGFDLTRWMLVRPASADDHLWSIEQCLRSRGCDAVVSHLTDVNDGQMRRFSLAAEEGSCLGLLLRPAALMSRPSPASVRLFAEPAPSPHPARRRMTLTVVRCRGQSQNPTLTLEWNRDPLDRPSFSLASDRTSAIRIPIERPKPSRSLRA